MKKLIITILVLSNLVFANYTRTAEDIVLDNNTNLQWQDNEVSSEITLAEAIEYCNNMTLGGYQDWRIPNFNELVSIVDYANYHPAMNSIFKKFVTRSYFSSTHSYNGRNIVTIDMDRGNTGGGVILYNPAIFNAKAYVRCVRGGL